jgi:hypothetical protein
MNAFPGAREEVVQKTRFGIAAAFLRAQRNQHSLHASAVAIGNGRAIACIGASGIGKSTVADRMCRHTDVLLLGDDVTGIALMPEGMVHVTPSESAVWLTTGECSEKRPTKRARIATQPAALACIVSLAFDESARSLQMRDLRGGEAVAALLPALIRFEATPDTWMREFSLVGELTSKSRIVEARRSHGVSADEVAKALLPLAAPEAR